MAQGKHRARRPVETSDFAAMLLRLAVAWGDRIAEDPAALVHFPEITQALTDQTSRGIWEANERGQYSQNHMAAILGTSRQAIQQRIARGRLVAAAVTEARGGGALVRLADIRARRAQLLAEAGVPDITGSEREKSVTALSAKTG